ncbi:MAG: hypothetical protein ACTSYX_11765 [Candidatus Thorarchaeota archaeon]
MSFDFLRSRSQQETGGSPAVEGSPQNDVDTETESVSFPTADQTDLSSGWGTTIASFLTIAVGFLLAAILSRYLDRESDSHDKRNGQQSFWRF